MLRPFEDHPALMFTAFKVQRLAPATTLRASEWSSPIAKGGRERERERERETERERGIEREGNEEGG